MRHSGSTYSVALAALIGVLAGAALVIGLGPRIRSDRPAVGPSVVHPQPAVSAESQDAITTAVQRVGPAVVNISTLFEPPRQDPFERLLRESLGMPTEPFPRAGQGSGVVIDGRRGYILTNAHVVKGARRLIVGLADGRRLEARVVGTDSLTEVAVVQVPGGDLPQATLGSAEALPIGAWVIAIGNPFGFANSVTVGVLSAKDRQIAGPNQVVLQDLLQTDASINPGNSGGALVDLNGAIVGIPTAVIPYAQGIGFAVSIDVARQVAERLIATGSMPWLGIQHRSLLPEEARRLGLPGDLGTMVFGVVPGGPADSAGLSPGDLIIRVADGEIESDGDLGRAIRAHDVGEQVAVTVLRDGREVTVSVKLGPVPEGGR